MLFYLFLYNRLDFVFLKSVIPLCLRQLVYCVYSPVLFYCIYLFLKKTNQNKSASAPWFHLPYKTIKRKKKVSAGGPLVNQAFLISAHRRSPSECHHVPVFRNKKAKKRVFFSGFYKKLQKLCRYLQIKLKLSAAYKTAALLESPFTDIHIST